MHVYFTMGKSVSFIMTSVLHHIHILDILSSLSFTRESMTNYMVCFVLIMTLQTEHNETSNSCRPNSVILRFLQ